MSKAKATLSLLKKWKIGGEKEREKEGEFPPEPIGCPNVQSVSLMQANE